MPEPLQYVLAAGGGFLLDVEQQVLVDRLLRGGVGEETLRAAFVEDRLRVARLAVAEQRDDVTAKALRGGGYAL